MSKLLATRAGYLCDKKTFPYETFIIPDSCTTPPFVHPLHDRYSTSVVPNLNSNNRVLSYPVLQNSSFGNSYRVPKFSSMIHDIHLIIIMIEKFILRLTAVDCNLFFNLNFVIIVGSNSFRILSYLFLRVINKIG